MPATDTENWDGGRVTLSRPVSVLLSVRLLGEARAQAEAAVKTLSDQQHTLKLPEAQLMLSDLALLQDDAERALTAASEAAAACTRLGRREWLALARYAQLQAQVQLSGQLDGLAPSTAPNAVSARRLRTAAGELESAGWIVPALEARLLAGRIALREGRVRSARADLRRRREGAPLRSGGRQVAGLAGRSAAQRGRRVPARGEVRAPRRASGVGGLSGQPRGDRTASARVRTPRCSSAGRIAAGPGRLRCQGRSLVERMRPGQRRLVAADPTARRPGAR